MEGTFEEGDGCSERRSFASFRLVGTCLEASEPGAFYIRKRKDTIWMARSGHYIGTVNGIVLCVDRNDKGTIEGRLYHGYEKEGIPFSGYEKVIRVAEELFNALGFPHMGTGDRDIHGRTRDYKKEEGMAKVMEDEKLLEQHGDMGTFVIRVQHRQHSSWQGKVTYLDEDKTVYFRSVLELIKIIDGVLGEAGSAEETD